MKTILLLPGPISQIRGRQRRGITLIELLVSVALTLIVLTAMFQAFKVASKQIREGRATLEMAASLRSVGEILRNDLRNVTVPLRPNALDAQWKGYFEYVEGLDDDASEAGVVLANNLANPVTAGMSYLGDHDDFLAMTVRSEGKPFRGRFGANMIESYLAEVIWWTVHNDTDGNGAVNYNETITLYRRVLLIRPDLTTVETDFDVFFRNNDISVRRTAGGGLAMNSLQDLTKRENRFAHNAARFPHEVMRGVLNGRPLTGSVAGDDIMLTDVAAFDVKVWSPNTQIKSAGDQVLVPNDPNYAAVTTAPSPPPATDGAYVDLGAALPFFAPGNPANAWFSGIPSRNSGLGSEDISTPAPNDGTLFTTLGNTWCTWSQHYETDGINQDVGDDVLVDQGSDGLDNDGMNGPDDDFELETRPPYPHPIRSLEITLRLIEKGTGQVRQTTIRESFTPE